MGDITVSEWKSDSSASSPAGMSFGELARDDLQQDRAAAMASSGHICTLTWECNC